MLLFLLNLALGVAVFLFWLLACVAVCCLAYTRRQRTAKAVAWTGLLLIGLGGLALVAKIVTSVYMWLSVGWWYAELSFLIVIPLLLPVTVLLAWFTLPRLWRIVRSANLTTAHMQRKRTEPWLVVPVQVAAVAGLFGIYAVMHVRTLAHALTVLVGWAIMTGVGAFLYYRRSQLTRQLTKTSQPLRARFFVLKMLVTVVVVGVIAGIAGVIDVSTSRLPDTYAMTDHPMESGKKDSGMNAMDHSHHAGAIDVTTLTEKDLDGPVRRVMLTAKEQEITLSSGKKIQALAFNGQVPGPEIRINQGDIVEATLINDLADRNVTLHWHGLDVPNAEDGVAGLTQDAVRPGESHTYRFKAKQVGTFWYHSHQQSSEQVEKGLYGALTILPKQVAAVNEHDIPLLYHEWHGGDHSLGLADTLQQQKLAPGTQVRLRAVNTSNRSTTFTLHGTPFRIAAIDGNAVNEPDELRDVRVRIPAGGKRDFIFTMPSNPVFFGQANSGAFTPKDTGTIFSPDGLAATPIIPAGSELDLLEYGKATTMEIDANTSFDRQFSMYFDSRVGFYNGKFGMSYATNGKLFPETGMHMVHEGDKVKTSFYNRSPQAHPMHLHGHQMLVLSRNGKSATGSPWWTDTLDVGVGESYEVAFIANNPGLWMDHCHNLEHAAGGMIMHLGYEGYTTPYLSGRATGNLAE